MKLALCVLLTVSTTVNAGEMSDSYKEVANAVQQAVKVTYGSAKTTVQDAADEVGDFAQAATGEVSAYAQDLGQASANTAKKGVNAAKKGAQKAGDLAQDAGEFTIKTAKNAAKAALKVAKKVLSFSEKQINRAYAKRANQLVTQGGEHAMKSLEKDSYSASVDFKGFEYPSLKTVLAVTYDLGDTICKTDITLKPLSIFAYLSASPVNKQSLSYKCSWK